MSMDYIRATYDVPAKRGARVEYTGGGEIQLGTVLGSRNAHLKILLDGERNARIFHPTWALRYLADAALSTAKSVEHGATDGGTGE